MQIPYRANLSAKGFPLLPSDMARTVILPGYDQNFNRQVTSRADADKDIGIPQIYALSNVLPTEQGIASARQKSLFDTFDSIKGYMNVLPVYTSTKTGWIWLSYDIATAPAQAKIYSQGPITEGVLATPAIINAAVDTVLGGVGGSLSVATVNGRCFVHTGKAGPTLYEWTDPLVALAAVALTVTGAPSTLFIASSNGYLLLFDKDTVYWSSPGNPTDFVPSLATGAGFQKIQDARGRIIFGIACPSGVLVFCENNIVLGQYSGNARFPFVFREVFSSGGIAFPGDVAIESQAAVAQYAYTSAGFVQITNKQCDLAFPDMQAFFRNRAIEESLDSGVTFFRATGTALNRRISFIAKRYLCISYGITAAQLPVSSLTYPIFEYVLVYDTILQRWGKLQFNHNSLFGVELAGPSVFSGAHEGIGYINTDGQAYAITGDPSTGQTVALPSYALLGKYQVSRSYMTGLQGVALENTAGVIHPICYDLYSMDGRTQIYEQLQSYYSRSNYIEFSSSRQAKNHSILLSCTGIQQSFNLNSLLLNFSKGARS